MRNVSNTTLAAQDEEPGIVRVARTAYSTRLKVTAVIGAVGPEAWTFVPPSPPVKLAIKLEDKMPFSASRSACARPKKIQPTAPLSPVNAQRCNAHHTRLGRLGDGCRALAAQAG